MIILIITNLPSLLFSHSDTYSCLIGILDLFSKSLIFSLLMPVYFHFYLSSDILIWIQQPVKVTFVKKTRLQVFSDRYNTSIRIIHIIFVFTLFKIEHIVIFLISNLKKKCFFYDCHYKRILIECSLGNFNHIKYQTALWTETEQNKKTITEHTLVLTLSVNKMYYSLDQHCPIELSEMMAMFYIYTVQ